MATTVGKLNVLLTASSRGLNTGLNRASASVRRFSRSASTSLAGFAKMGLGNFKSLALGAGLSAAGIGLAFRSSAMRIDEVAKASRKLLGNQGATGALEGIRLAANEAGIDTEKLNTGMRKLLDTMGRAKAGDKGAIAAFERLGISARELQTLRPENALARIGDAVKEIPELEAKVAALGGVFGTRQGGDLVNLFATGGQAIRDAQAQVEKFGKSLTALESARVEQMNDSWGRTKLALSGLFDQLTVRLAPIVTSVNEKFLGMIDRLGGVGEASETTFNYLVEGVATAADSVESADIAWLKFKRTVTGVSIILVDIVSGMEKIAKLSPLAATERFIKKFTGDGGGDPEAELERRAQMVAPKKREEFKRLARESGGFGDERVNIRKGLEDENAEIQAAIADREKRRNTKGSAGDRFKRFVFEATQQADQTNAAAKLDTMAGERGDEEQKTLDILEKQKKVIDEMSGTLAGRDQGLTAFGGPASAFEDANRKSLAMQQKMAETEKGGKSGSRSENLLEQINSKLGRGVPAVYSA